MDELIARLEAASEGDTGLRVIGGLDDQIWRLVNDKQWFFTGWQYDLKEAPHYTTSLDAALTLAPNGWSVSVSRSEKATFANAVLGRSYPTNAKVVIDASTPALALCIAALRALSHTPQEK